MSITANFYTFNKKNNSTKVPTGSGTSINIVLKEDVSILTPTIRVSLTDAVLSYNYCYIPTFSRYYFITDIVSSKGFWEISLKVDSLASYKAGIGSMTPYVLRAASESDEYIIDDMYPGDSYITTFIANPIDGQVPGAPAYTSYSKPLSLREGYSYILGIIGAASGAIGSVTYYQMNQNQLNLFMGYLFGMTSTWSDIDTSDYSDGVQRALLNPMQYIVSCIMVPFSHIATLGDDNTIYFGTYEYTGTEVAKKLYAEAGVCVREKVSIIRLPSHPQASIRGKYLNGAPYSKYWLHVGPYGDIPINANIDELITTDPTDVARYISCDFCFDMISGMCELIVYPDVYTTLLNFAHAELNNTVRLATVSFQAGVPIQLAQAYTDPLAIQEAHAQFLAGAIGGFGQGLVDPAGAAVNAMTSIPTGIGNILRAGYPTVASTGSNGSAIQGYLNDEGVYIRSEHNRIVNENNTDLGRPLCKTKTINTLSGFILCSSADFGGAGTEEERAEINNYMNTGFFYE